MSTIDVGPKSFIRPYRGPVRTREYKEEASQSYLLGAVVVSDGTNKNEVEEAGADPTSKILGIAAEAASGVTDQKRLVWLAEPGVEFIAHIEDTGVLADTMEGTAFGLVKDSTNGIWRVDTTETTNTNVIVTELIDEEGDVNGRVAFQFKASARGEYQG